MTGYGHATAEAEGLRVAVEVRTVNGRNADVTLRTPRALHPHEADLQRRVRAALERGKMYVSVQAERDGASAAPVRLNEPAAKALAEVLERLRFITRVQQPVGLDHLIAFRELFEATEGDEPDAEALLPLTLNALDEALAACTAMRRREGEALAADLRARLDAIEAELTAVEAAAPERLAAAHATLRQRLAALLDGETRVPADRLDVEIALLADKLDVNEECVRLRSHLDQFRAALDDEEAAGRRLGFLAQEFNREINTIASKANDAGIAARAVTMKEELEKIREQVLNVV